MQIFLLLLKLKVLDLYNFTLEHSICIYKYKVTKI